jgi:hypothetical protein
VPFGRWEPGQCWAARPNALGQGIAGERFSWGSTAFSAGLGVAAAGIGAKMGGAETSSGPSPADRLRGFLYDEQGGSQSWSIRARLRAAGPGEEYGLPYQGRIRFIPEEGYNPNTPLPRGPQNGYIDRFGNEWVVGPSRTPVHPYEWDVQLSRVGRSQLGWLSSDSDMAHVNVSPLGEITH